ncbi:hypothetical protein GCM10023321_81040 [Pseudonocardia eucalypti]|uniref:Uncharacterized protein n=1 Tax=Pseudonocardia eucalypti TaxID=648755 RepID=A0ABP9RCT3_9PSEU
MDTAIEVIVIRIAPLSASPARASPRNPEPPQSAGTDSRTNHDQCATSKIVIARNRPHRRTTLFTPGSFAS